jgi:hypothetical protein
MERLERYIQDDHKYRKFCLDDPEDRAAAQTLFSEFLEACRATKLLDSEVEKTNLAYEEDVIIEIVERVRMRKLYFYIYHDIVPPDDSNELKEAALYAFWILKLHPFRWKAEYQGPRERPIPNYELNARVALGLFLRGLRLYADSKTQLAKDAGQSDSFVVSVERSSSSVIQTLYYSFRYRDWSKEALMDMAEAMIISADNGQQEGPPE